MTTPSHTMLAEAIAAARAGDRGRARDLLARLLRTDSANAEYWVWMSSVVDTKRERIYCLESALNVDPTNRAALRGLVILGARKPQAPPTTPDKLPRRKITARTGSAASVQPAIDKRYVSLGCGGLLVLVAIAGVAWAFQSPRAVPPAPTLPPRPTDTPTPTPVTPTITPTPIPVETRIYRTPIPAEYAATPIVFFVPETPTPTPILGLTPHPSYEAYAAGIAALQAGDYEASINFMEQVSSLSEALPDPHYFRGEALRLMDNPADAIRAYDRAILVDPDFAPAYIGRGLAQIDATRRRKPELSGADMPADLDRAIEKDPQLIDAYLVKAEFLASTRLWKTMEETLQAALDAGLRTPRIYIQLSVAQFNRQKYEAALRNAIEGSATDPTDLDGYLAVGRGHVAVGEYESAIWPLQTYVVYRPEDHVGWANLGEAQFETGDVEAGLASVDAALSLNDRYAPAYLTKGRILLDQNEPGEALNNLLRARQYGTESPRLWLGIARAQYLLSNYRDALSSVNQAISIDDTPAGKAEGYALRAFIYEATNPPLIDEAIRNWRWVLEIPEARPELHTVAQVHLNQLAGPDATTTPTPEAIEPTATAE